MSRTADISSVFRESSAWFKGKMQRFFHIWEGSQHGLHGIFFPTSELPSVHKISEDRFFVAEKLKKKSKLLQFSSELLIFLLITLTVREEEKCLSERLAAACFLTFDFSVCVFAARQGELGRHGDPAGG